MIETGISFDNFTLKKGRRQLFADFSINLCLGAQQSGKIIAVLGASGVGKSTLLQVIADPVLRDEYEGVQVRLSGGHLAYVPQKAVLVENLDVRSNINLFDRIRALREAVDGANRSRVTEVLHMQEFIDRADVSSLSGGEKQRVMIARTLSLSPSLLLLDEPLNSLDPTVKLELLLDLRHEIVKHKILCLYVTHNIEEAKLIADEVLLLEGTKQGVCGLHATYPISEFFQNPPNKAVAGYSSYPYFAIVSLLKASQQQDILNYLPTLHHECRSIGFDGRVLKVRKGAGLPVTVTSVTSESIFLAISLKTISANVALRADHQAFLPAPGSQLSISLDVGLYQFDGAGKTIQSQVLKADEAIS